MDRKLQNFYPSKYYDSINQSNFTAHVISNPLVKHVFEEYLSNGDISLESSFKKILMFENCTENGYLFSCFENFGLIKNSNQCGSICESKNLNQLGINDFYNFHDRLQQSNFFLKARDAISYVLLYRTKYIELSN